ncbi:SDR family oxidoreductase [Phycicoccus endophyticus]|uniref:SDR family oxidoreductase n=1 Tax=Phycicoccus endophyticus TaxID=1690220 RepID=A0A7G9QY89_9MICO|nr:SDR family oxidoreductase [Phycicoccus endophyticus]NHI19204.1 SDR family oxidoreductase [Phycicoccus endophyticus]QNN48314.1 SDR family oxidoreductase [Phycicoccus endophyticus]GGL40943.1 3-oxoacyl-ACP reductase [Phycicoccus endophyticus]
MTENTTPSTPKIALVTGANRGLGREEALALAADGVDLVITYRSHEDEAHAVVGKIEQLGRRAVALRLDTSAHGSFPAFVDTLLATLRATWGRDTLDVLVNNAGHSDDTVLGSITREHVHSLVDVHFTGVLLLTDALVPHLADGGRIVNTSSGLARFSRMFQYAVYGAMKGAVEVWTRYLANELGPRGITVNAVAPGATATDFGGGSLRDDEATRAGLAQVIAMGHVGRPEDIGAAVAAIASERMRWVTGQRIEASGGMFL